MTYGEDMNGSVEGDINVIMNLTMCIVLYLIMNGMTYLVIHSGVEETLSIGSVGLVIEADGFQSYIFVYIYPSLIRSQAGTPS